MRRGWSKKKIKIITRLEVRRCRLLPRGWPARRVVDLGRPGRRAKPPAKINAFQRDNQIWRDVSLSSWLPPSPTTHRIWIFFDVQFFFSPPSTDCAKNVIFRLAGANRESAPVECFTAATPHTRHNNKTLGAHIAVYSRRFVTTLVYRVIVMRIYCKGSCTYVHNTETYFEVRAKRPQFSSYETVAIERNQKTIIGHIFFLTTWLHATSSVWVISLWYTILVQV